MTDNSKQSTCYFKWNISHFLPEILSEFLNLKLSSTKSAEQFYNVANWLRALIIYKISKLYMEIITLPKDLLIKIT